METFTAEAGENRKIVVEVSPGDTIWTVAKRMTDACVPQSYTYAVFNGTELTAGGGDTPEEIVEKYMAARSEQSS